MLAEKYILKGTDFYKNLSSFFSIFNKFFNLKPLRWFAIWAMVISGNNVIMHIEDRWFYWKWDSFSLYLFIALIISIIFDFIFTSKLKNITNYSPYLYQLIIFIYGYALFLIGANPLYLSLDLLTFGIPYVLFFLVGHMTWKLSFNAVSEPIPSKKDLIPSLVFIILCTIIISTAGFINDDPMISTIAAVFLPFPLVAVLFPIAIRHFQRCRMYVVFIPTMFLTMRYPWFIFLTLPLFLFSRYYFYFISGKVIPTFKVDSQDHEFIK